MTLEQYTLVAATHRKLEKAANGTSTQVVSCMINKWRTKINGKEVYNVGNPLGMGDKKKKKRLREDGCCFYHPGKLL